MVADGRSLEQDFPVCTVQYSGAGDRRVLNGDGLVPACDDGTGVRDRVAVQRQVSRFRGDGSLVGEVRIDEAVGPPLGRDRQVLADRKSVPVIRGPQIAG